MDIVITLISISGWRVAWLGKRIWEVIFLTFNTSWIMVTVFSSMPVILMYVHCSGCWFSTINFKLRWDYILYKNNFLDVFLILTKIVLSYVYVMYYVMYADNGICINCFKKIRDDLFEHYKIDYGCYTFFLVLYWYNQLIIKNITLKRLEFS